MPNGTVYRRWRARDNSSLAAFARRLLAHDNPLSFPYRQASSRRSLPCCSTAAAP
ncbi:MAG TPA: hypothetical protein VN607_07180 [Gemmatimonadaceae bacterium]|nr:hypothetical protein [Gemmatimonadaceae bacterium]